MLYSNQDGVRLVSRNGNTFKSFPALCGRISSRSERSPLRAGRRSPLPQS
ncbi:MAG: hypothetical protein ACM34E_00490 [Acidobacteriota bacterium]